MKRYELQVLSLLLPPSLCCPWIYKQSLREIASKKCRRQHFIRFLISSISTNYEQLLQSPFPHGTSAGRVWQTAHLGVVLRSGQQQAERTLAFQKQKLTSFAQTPPAHHLLAAGAAALRCWLLLPFLAAPLWSHPVSSGSSWAELWSSPAG